MPHRHTLLYVTDTSEATEATTLDLMQVELNQAQTETQREGSPLRAHEAAQLPALELIPPTTS